MAAPTWEDRLKELASQPTGGGGLPGVGMPPKAAAPKPAGPGPVARAVGTGVGSIVGGMEAALRPGEPADVTAGRTDHTIRALQEMWASVSALPQSGAEALSIAGTVAPALGVTGVIPLLSKLSPAIQRIVGAVIGGEIGGQMEGAPTGSGALTGAAAIPAEAGLAALEKGARSVAGARGLIARKDAANVENVIRQQVPSLEPVLTGPKGQAAERLSAAGQGKESRSLLSANYRAKLAEAESSLPVSTQTLPNGTTTVNPPMLNVPSLGKMVQTQYGPMPVSSMTLPEAAEALKLLGDRGFGGSKANPLTRDMSGADARQLYAKAKDEITAELVRLDPTGSAARAFTEGRHEYAVGSTLLRTLAKEKVYDRAPADMQLSMGDLQGIVRKNRALIQQSMTPDEWRAFQDVVWRGGNIEYQDAMRGGLNPMSLLQRAGLGAAAGGAAGLGIGSIPGLTAGAGAAAAFPNIASRYAAGPGRQPLSIPANNTVKSIADIVSQIATGRFQGSIGGPSTPPAQ